VEHFNKHIAIISQVSSVIALGSGILSSGIMSVHGSW